MFELIVQSGTVLCQWYSVSVVCVYSVLKIYQFSRIRLFSCLISSYLTSDFVFVLANLYSLNISVERQQEQLALSVLQRNLLSYIAWLLHGQMSRATDWMDFNHLETRFSSLHPYEERKLSLGLVVY